MVAVAVPMREDSKQGAAKSKALAPSPALSSISTIAFSDVDGLYLSDDDDEDNNDDEYGDMSSDVLPWGMVGSRLAPVFAFASLRDGNMSEDSPVCKPESEIASPSEVIDATGDERTRFAVTIREAASQADFDDQSDETCFTGPTNRSVPRIADGDVEEQSWRLVSLRLAGVFFMSTHTDDSAADRASVVSTTSVEE